ncbi:hypothetical protein KVR01_013376 [Diaporthe batatas]|uniref:uncharacterized protein n=1 Tax=Diaporthe batatas TaxID=748121 RepID=UPI001D04FA1C|nr:uncharacterized protein KVR01_013376 [Diaporthe batatas]KAG8156771.1 hypothetical protein KVR01_013376 [Diaporthe batatas]
MANLMIQSQESHLLSPDISPAGSDSGHVEDLRGLSFPSLAGKAQVEKHHHQTSKEEATTKAAATPSLGQKPQHHTSLNPSTCRSKNSTSATTTNASKSKAKSKSKPDPSQTTRQPAPGQGNRLSKSNNTTIANAKMTSSKAEAKKTRRSPTPINVQIIRATTSPPSSSSSSSSSSTSSQQQQHQHGPPAFTMTLLPMTKIRELCLHASAHARRHLGLVLDGSRLEARDRDGHVFGGHEAIAEEVLRGETIFLVEGGLDARGRAEAEAEAAAAAARSRARRSASRSRERGRLLCLKSLELEGEGEGEVGARGAPYRTPSVSSGASSSSSSSQQGAASGSKAGGSKRPAGPRVTPSQRALAIAQMAAAQEPVVPRRRPAAAANRSLPSPALEKVGGNSSSSDSEQQEEEGPGDDTLVGDDADGLEGRTLVAAPAEARIATPPPSSPKKQHDDHHQEVPPNLQDSQLVIPDSQDPFSEDLFSQQSAASQPHPAAPQTSSSNHPEPPDDASRAHSQQHPRVRATPTATSTAITATTTPATARSLPTSKPDPYDINNVLSDDDGDGDGLSDESNTTNKHTLRMARSVRKLGSATATRKAVAPPPSPRRRAQSNPPPPSPSRADRAGAATSTPTNKATPVKAGPSSPAAPLPSSPTTRAAAKRRDRTPQLPGPGQPVIRVPSDSEDADDFITDQDLMEGAFRDMSACNRSPSSLPWSQPPLRAAAGSPGKSPVRKPAPPPSPGRRRGPIKPSSVITSPSKREEATIVHDSESEYEQENPLVKTEGRAGGPVAGGHLRGSLAKMMPPPPLPRKQSSQRSPVKSAPIITSPSKREEATVIHDASSAESEDERDARPVKKEEAGEGLSPFLGRGLADIPAIDEKPPRGESNQHEVIELSSGSESDYDLLEDMLEEEQEVGPEPELPAIDADELHVQGAQAPSLRQYSARVDRPLLPESSPRTDPVKIEPDCEEAPPSAQTSKRRRDASREPDPREEDHRETKRAKRQAKKARQKENRAHRESVLLQQQEEDELAALEEVRKEVALERAHRRALELELIVSSPARREPGLDPGEEEADADDDDDDDSGVGSSPPTDDSGADDAGPGVPLDMDDKNDSLSGKEAEASPDQQPGGQPTSTPAIIEAQLQQCVVEERFRRMLFDDWAFLESTLGKGPAGDGHGHGHGHHSAALEAHQRVHFDMMDRAARHAPVQVFAMQEEEPSNDHNDPQNEGPEPCAPVDVAVGGGGGDDDEPARERSQRSEAPSPKERRAEEQRRQELEQVPEQEEEEKPEERLERKKKKKQTNNRLKQQRARKEKHARLANKSRSRYHHDFRPSHAGLLKEKKKERQRQRQRLEQQQQQASDGS